MVAACGLCGGSFEAALKSGNVSAALAFMDDDPLAVARTPFARGNTLWHIAAKCGSLEMLQALLARLQAVWPDTSIQREQVRLGAARLADIFAQVALARLAEVVIPIHESSARAALPALHRAVAVS